jgi:Tfp pilus assembly protein FimT
LTPSTVWCLAPSTAGAKHDGTKHGWRQARWHQTRLVLGTKHGLKNENAFSQTKQKKSQSFRKSHGQTRLVFDTKHGLVFGTKHGWHQAR